MHREIVESSNLKSLGYDAARRLLEAEFHAASCSAKSGGKCDCESGPLYQYADVPERVYDAVMYAKSKGKAFHNLVEPYYEYERVHE